MIYEVLAFGVNISGVHHDLHFYLSFKANMSRHYHYFQLLDD